MATGIAKSAPQVQTCKLIERPGLGQGAHIDRGILFIETSDGNKGKSPHHCLQAMVPCLSKQFSDKNEFTRDCDDFIGETDNFTKSAFFNARYNFSTS